jgi:hypothetical protein
MDMLPDMLSLPKLRRLEHNPAAVPGVYGLFLAPNSRLPFVDLEPHGLVYIGKASGRTGFAGRCHFDGARTLNHSPRKSLTGLLRETLGLKLQGHPPKKWGLTLASDQDLTSWMHSHLLVSYHECKDAAAVERGLIGFYAPALNLKLCLQGPQHLIVQQFRSAAEADALGRYARELH